MAQRLRTTKKVADDSGLSVDQVRALIHKNLLRHVMIGKRPMIPDGAFEQFIEENTVQSCQDETPVPASDFSKSVVSTTSSGPNPAAVGSARLVQQIGKKLKSCSRNSCTDDNGPADRVIPLKSS